MGAILALSASLFWGSADFLGGSLSRRAHALTVMRLTQSIALVGLVVIAAVAGELDAALTYLPWGLAAGVAGAIALGCFYAALAAGTMGVVAPVAATGVVVPVAVGLIQGESPSLAQLVGTIAAVVGVVLASGPERGDDGRRSAPPRRPLLLSGVAAAGFGAGLVLVAEGAETSVVMTLVTMRATNALVASLVLLVAVRAAVRPTTRDLPTLTVIGTGDAAANGAYALATREALVSVSAVLASLYPAVTALLAWRFHGERLKRTQTIGVAVTLAGVALMAAG